MCLPGDWSHKTVSRRSEPHRSSHGTRVTSSLAWRCASSGQSESDRPAWVTYVFAPEHGSDFPFYHAFLSSTKCYGKLSANCSSASLSSGASVEYTTLAGFQWPRIAGEASSLRPRESFQNGIWPEIILSRHTTPPPPESQSELGVGKIRGLVIRYRMRNIQTGDEGSAMYRTTDMSCLYIRDWQYTYLQKLTSCSAPRL